MSEQEADPKGESFLPPLPPVPPPPAATRNGRKFLVVGLLVAIVSAGVGVAIVMQSGSDDRATGSPSTSPTASPTAEAPARPSAFTTEAGAFKVTLTWEPGAGGGEVDGFEITRDGVLVADLGSDEREFVDRGVLPDSTYRYSLAAVGADERSSVTVNATVETPTAAPGVARLEGVFDVRLDPISHWGYSSFDDDVRTAGWRFVPACEKGPCDTALWYTGLGGLKSKLARGTTYEGTASSRGFSQCGSTPSLSSLAFDLVPKKAEVIDGRWRVTVISGTLTQREAPQLGCVSGGVNYKVTGELVR